MKYLKLFEQFEEGHKFDIFDLFTISPNEVKELFFKELDKRNPDLENIQVFLDSGLVDVNARDEDNDYKVPLYVAAERNHLELAKLLISSGADVNAKSGWGRVPLYVAAERNHLEVAQLLISSGADVNAKDSINGYTPLHMTAWGKSLAVAQLLISSGADVNLRDKRGWEPLHYAPHTLEKLLGRYMR